MAEDGCELIALSEVLRVGVDDVGIGEVLQDGMALFGGKLLYEGVFEYGCHLFVSPCS